ncbi:hypothetical protein TraAM80_00633 [Trypanosoma rangeli]|uniref:Uncharacterized protein n=1 Tax=Trypanosoma rangeli TaxID=5698 RepID=A0A3R7KY05_TRYRA|nr:uncharacterized protein TraAM80_00633 [Trypanosoma rangeli]RNF11938.1 hypothetical protein TraAM80_00633 [Trypanosoma rangeli]|eukprot:RNF11938.1 hypothetical protein TraAM80_00633 [Trypanosoma rangeli]
MRPWRVYAFRTALSSWRRASSTKPRQGTVPVLEKVLTHSENGTVGLELCLPPLASVAASGRHEMQGHVRRTVETVETVLHACDDATLQLDYVTLRCCASFSAGESWTDEESQLACSFLREVALHLLPMTPVCLLFPITAFNAPPLSCVSDMFDMLHRVGWKNVQLELPPSSCTAVLRPTAEMGCKETAQSSLHAAVGGWTTLLHGTEDHLCLPRSTSIPWKALFPWILRKGFLDRFSVGLSVDLYASLRSLSILHQAGDGSKGVCHATSSLRRVQARMGACPKQDRPLEFQQPTRNEAAAPVHHGNKQPTLQTSQEGKGQELLTLSAPSKEFSDLFLAQHQSFLDAAKSEVNGGSIEQDALMLTEFLQQITEERAPKHESQLQTKRAIHVQHGVGVMHEEKGKDDVAVGRKLGKGSLYWQLLGDIARRTHARYLCTMPCANPASIQAWKHAYAEVFACAKQQVKQQGDVFSPCSTALLPIVNTLWPLLYPVQLERARRQTFSTFDTENTNFSKTLAFLSQETQQALQQALREMPPLFLQQTVNDAVQRRGETHINYEAGGVRLLCGSDGCHKTLDMLGAGVATRQALFSAMPARQVHHIRDVENTFFKGPMKKAFESTIGSLCVEDLHARKCHLRVSVPCDVELPELVESLRLLCLGAHWMKERRRSNKNTNKNESV